MLKKWGILGVSTALLFLASCEETNPEEDVLSEEENGDETEVDAEETQQEEEEINLTTLIEEFEPEEVEGVEYSDTTDPEDRDASEPVVLLNFDERFPNLYGENSERIPGLLEFRWPLYEIALEEHYLSDGHVDWLDTIEEIVTNDQEVIDVGEGFYTLYLGDLNIGGMSGKDYFLAVNKSEETYRNFGFEVTVTSDSIGTIIENREVFLSERFFGELEPYTVMPFYVDLHDQEEQFDLWDASIENDIATTTDNIQNNVEVPDEYSNGYSIELVNRYIGEEDRDPMDRGILPIYPNDAFDQWTSEQLEPLTHYVSLFKQTIYAHPATEEPTAFWPGIVMQPAGTEELYVPIAVYNTTDNSYYNVDVHVGLFDGSGDSLLVEENVNIGEETYDFNVNRDDFPLFIYDEVAIVFLEIPEDEREAALERFQEDRDIYADIEVLDVETLFDR